MSGRASRQKGLRGEYEIRDYFRSLGYEANRVPSSGAAEGFKGDIVVKTPDRELRPEVKLRKTEYLSVYRLYDSVGAKPTYFSWGSVGCIVSDAFRDLGYTVTDNYVQTVGVSGSKPKLKGVKKLFGLQKLVKTCDFLVIRCNHKQPLFIRFFECHTK